MKPNFYWGAALIVALLGSSTLAAGVAEFIPRDEWYGLARAGLAGIPGALVSWLFDMSKHRKRNAPKNILAGFAAASVAAFERDYLKLPLTLPLEFALGGAVGFFGGEYAFKWLGKRVGLVDQ